MTSNQNATLIALSDAAADDPMTDEVRLIELLVENDYDIGEIVGDLSRDELERCISALRTALTLLDRPH